MRRGYFVEGLGAAQFATAGRGRPAARASPGRCGDDAGPRHAASGAWPPRDPANAVRRARLDPAEPVRRAPWPVAGSASGHQPGRKAGALVVLVDGALVLYVERGGRACCPGPRTPSVLQAAADALALAVREGALGRLTVERADGEQVLAGDHPLAQALEAAGFHATPRGLRLRA